MWLTSLFISLRKPGFSLSPLTNGDSSVNQDVLLIDFFSLWCCYKEVGTQLQISESHSESEGVANSEFTLELKDNSGLLLLDSYF